MSKARNLADVISGAFDVPAGALDNVEGLPDAIDVDASAPADSLAIDSSGNVGVGTTGPNGVLTLDRSTNTNADTMYILRGSGNSLPASIDTQTALLVQNRTGTFSTNISIIADGAGGGLSGLNLGDESDENVGSIQYLHASDSMRFNVNGNQEAMRISSSGQFIVGGTSTGDMVRFNNNTASGWLLNLNNANASNQIMISAQSGTGTVTHHQFNNSNGKVGSIVTSGSSTAYYTSSDYRLKENVVDMTGAITRVKSLAPKRFNFIADDDDTTVDGFLAHEAQTVVPESVNGTHNEVDDDGNPVYQGIDQSKLVPLLTGALQEAIAKIETLETTVADLQTRVTALETN